MKPRNLIIAIMLLTGNLGLKGQQSRAMGNLLFEDTLSFTPLHEFISISDPDNSIWQIGIPESGVVDSTFSGKEAIYAEVQAGSSYDNIDYFLVSIPAEENWWGEGILSFYHYYHTDSLLNGGFIEVSYDGGITWKNILQDIHHINHNFIGIYTEADTILGGINAFSGRSVGWVYTELYWQWIAMTKKGLRESYGTPIIRFSFVCSSDPLTINTWIIDSIVLRGYSIFSSAEAGEYPEVNIFPNPASDALWVEVSEPITELNFEIYNIVGERILENQLHNTSHLNISSLSPGIYMLVTRDGDAFVSINKFLKE